MAVRKRNGDAEPVDVMKIVRAVERWCDDLAEVDPMAIATRTISGLYDGATTAELDRLSIQTAAEMTAAEPEYSRLAARLLSNYIDKEVRGQQIASFSQAVRLGHLEGLIGDETAAFVEANARKLDHAVDLSNDRRFEYFGLRTVYDRYLLRHPDTRQVIETPQYFLLRVACGLSHTPQEAIAFYRLMASLAYLPSSPTLFNSGTRHTQMSSCYLVDSPQDELESIYDRYAQVAKLSKFAGGIGISWSRVRSRGALIRGTNGHSNGIVPWLRTLDSSVSAVNQGGRRKGAACVYLEPWHPDIEEFLELRDNTGEDARRTHNLNLANWVPDEFMRRVEADEQWSLIDPNEVPELPDLWGPAFEEAYAAAERDGRFVRQVSARELYGKMMRTLAQTGNGWMTFKDASNRTCNQTSDEQGPGAPVVHLSNLCTEIIEVSSNDETAVCNLGSVNLAQHLTPGRDAVDWDKLRATVRTAVTYLDRVIDINYYPSEESAASNPRWRPVGLGVMGLQDVLFALRLPFDSAQAQELSTRIAEEVYLSALERSTQLAADHGAHPAYEQTRAARGDLQPDLWEVTPTQTERWDCGAEGHRGERTSQLAAHRDRSDGHDRLDRRRLRVHRAAGVQPVQARDPVGGVPPGQHRPGPRAQGPWAVDPGGARGDQAQRRLGAGDRRDPRGRAAAVPHRLGAAAEVAHRHRRGASALHRPEPVAQPVPRLADDREAQLDVPLRVEGRAQDDLLPAVAPGDPHPAGDRPSASATTVPPATPSRRSQS